MHCQESSVPFKYSFVSMLKVLATQTARNPLLRIQPQQKRRAITYFGNIACLSRTLDDIETYFSRDKKLQTKLDSAKHALPVASNTEDLGYVPATVTLGVVQSDDIKSGLFLDSIMTDALSSDDTYPRLLQEFRHKYPGENIKVVRGAVNDAIGGGIFESTSSLMNHESRLIQDAQFGDGSSKYLNRETFNDLAFVEVNDTTFSQHLKVDGTESIQLNETPKDDTIKESDIQIWVNISSGNAAVRRINDLPYFTVLNTTKESPRAGTSLSESLKEHTFPIDLGKLETANKLIKESIANTSTYLDLYRQSNINELLYTINQETSGYKPLILSLRSISRDLHLDSSSDIAVAKQLKQEIADWSQESHFELQSRVTPFLEEVLLKDFTRITQLLYNSGDLTLVISNLLNGTRAKVKNGLFGKEIECYGSLKESVSKAHYLEGRIDALFPDGIYKGDEVSEANLGKVDEFVDELQGKVANEKLPALQSQINKYLINDLLAAPSGVFVMCNVGYIYDFITLNTAVAVSALVLAATVNTSHKKIIRIIGEFKDWYLEQLRIHIDKTCELLGERLIRNIAEFETTQKKKSEIMLKLKTCIEDLEKADAGLHENRK